MYVSIHDAVSCSVLQGAVVCYSELQCLAVCCSALRSRRAYKFTSMHVLLHVVCVHVCASVKSLNQLGLGRQGGFCFWW